MTNETRQRIKAYQEALPGMKGRVAAAALGLVIAASLLVTGSYAWLTLSAAPEVQGLATTVTGNGSLEIALATSNTPPAPSGRGDSTAAGKDVTEANPLWGNLINLSDPSYGLSNMTLRPAALNGTTGLLTNPLYGVEYGDDGRVIQTTTKDDFAYCYYQPGDLTTESAFLVDEDDSHWGVRAISTVTYTNLTGNLQMQQLVEGASRALNSARINYANMTQTDSLYISALEGLLKVYVQDQVDGILGDGEAADTEVTRYMADMSALVNYLVDDVYDQALISYMNVANLYQLVDGDQGVNGGVFYTDPSALVTDARAGKWYSKIPLLKSFANDYYNFINSYQKTINDLAAQAAAGQPVYWSDVSSTVWFMVNTSTVEINGMTIGELGSDIGKALEMLGGDDNVATINDSALYRLEKCIGQKMSPKVSIGVKVLFTVTIEATVVTSAQAPWDLETELDKAIEAQGQGYEATDPVAEDTYALSLDFWVRSNAGASVGATSTVTEQVEDDGSEVTTTTYPVESFLTLEGKVITTTEQVEVMVTGADGKPYPAYTYTFSVNGQEGSVEGYLKEGTYYVGDKTLEDYLDSSSVSESQVTKTPKMETITTVTGYEGVNRVWSEEQMAWVEAEEGSISTTQGGGSCYVFYASNEADQKRFLELLSAMKVVFVDGNGNQIGLAVMDVDNTFASNGRFTVPLKLDPTTSTYLGQDLDGNDIYGLMPLDKDAATRITALIYLDGNMLDNSMVLASGDIQGSLNIQFGNALANLVETTTAKVDGTTTTSEKYVLSDEESLAIRDEDVMNDHIAISANVDKAEFEYQFDEPAVTNLTVTVDGVEPSTVEARFVRAISTTQGVLQPSIPLRESGNNWTAEVTLKTPGVYKLRAVWVDGVEYPLAQEIVVTVNGSSVNSVFCAAIPTGNSASIMTADTSFTTSVTLVFTTSEQVLTSVRGIFLDEKGQQVTATLKADATTGNWVGNITFPSSGTYTMKYVEVNGEQYEVRSDLQPTLNLLLGLKMNARITADEATLEALKKVNPSATPVRFTLSTVDFPDGVPLMIEADILDNRGQPIEGLDDANVYYYRVGSSNEKLDAELTWDAQAGKYTGDFLVTKAGSYAFTQLTVGDNTITAGTGATTVQAMPPDDAEYVYHDTKTEQIVLDGSNAQTILGIAYSEAATKVEVTMVKDGVEYVVESTQSAEDTTDSTITRWAFQIPAPGGSQDGNWTVKSLTLYGVYYDGVLYEGEESGDGVTVDLTRENITTRVVDKFYVTLAVSGNTTFNGQFMDAHTVSGSTITIQDFEGQAIEGITDVKFTHKLDTTTVSQFGYTAGAGVLGNTMVEGTITPTTDTQYAVGDMTFRTAGNYIADLSFTWNGRSYNQSNTNVVYRWLRNGENQAGTLQYQVNWSAPTVTIIGVQPGVDTGIPTKNNGTQYNSYSAYSATVYATYKKGGICSSDKYTASQLWFRLANAGIADSGTWAESYTTMQAPNFRGNGESDWVDIGTVYNGEESFTPAKTVSISTIRLTYNGNAYTVRLSNTLTINNPM